MGERRGKHAAADDAQPAEQQTDREIERERSELRTEEDG